MARTGIGSFRVLVIGLALGSAAGWSGGARAGALSSEVLWGGPGAGGNEACLRAGGRVVEMPVAHVNPFGKGGGSDGGLVEYPHEERSALCVFGAVSPAAERNAVSAWRVAASDGEEVATGSIAQAPFGGRCAEECDSSLTLLAEPDREALIALPERLARTLEALPAGVNGDGGTRVAREAAASLAGRSAEPELLVAPLDLTPGDMDCTWRRFEGGRAVTEPTERCRIGRDETGAPTLAQVTGESLLLRLEPLTDQYAVFLGRSLGAGEPPRPYDVDAADMGNRTGLAARVGNQVHLVGASGVSGFAVLTLSGN